jgi:hypothetical protein
MKTNRILKQALEYATLCDEEILQAGLNDEMANCI